MTDVRVVQVYKTGEKLAGMVSRRGPKPQGWNVYRNGVLIGFVKNVAGVYDLNDQETNKKTNRD